MNDLKFRAWHIAQKKMYHNVRIGGFEETVPTVFRPAEAGIFDASEWVHLWADNKEGVVMQHTGRLEKNGTDICEGDIIYRHDLVDGGGCMGYDYVYFNKHTLSWGFISWNKNFTPFHKWRVDGSTDGGGVVSSDVFELIKCEAIGNIYEHPELLKVGANNAR